MPTLTCRSCGRSYPTDPEHAAAYTQAWRCVCGAPLRAAAGDGATEGGEAVAEIGEPAAWRRRIEERRQARAGRKRLREAERARQQALEEKRRLAQDDESQRWAQQEEALRSEADHRVELARGDAERRAMGEITALDEEIDRARTAEAEATSRLTEAEARAMRAETRVAELETELARRRSDGGARSDPAQSPAAEPPDAGAHARSGAHASDLAPPPESVSLESGTLEEFRALGMSVTQARRLLTHRERAGGFRSLDELDELPGFPRDLVAQLKQRLSV